MEPETREKAASDREAGAEGPPSESLDAAGAKFVGRYRLCFELSSGGMAGVYLARVDGPARFQKLVALKRIHPHLAKEHDFIEMFLDEAAIAARIDHPNVCSVFDFGREEDSYFLAMEYLVGEPLSRIVKAAKKREALDSTRHAAMVARVIADACEGLHAAHELRNAKGEPLYVVHRDISPDNIFVTYDGVSKIVDFGVASARERIHKTTTGLVKGKHSYMAPEQLGSEPLDRRVDVWSMGVVMWEALCRRRLFRRGSQSATLMAVMRDRIPAPSEVQPDLPAELDRIVAKALTRDLDGRYASAREMANDLRRHLNRLQDPVGAPEVAEWVEELLPGSREQKRELMEIALSLPDTLPPLPGKEYAEQDTGSMVDSASAVAPRRQGRRSRWPWLVAAVVALAVAGAGAWLWRDGAESPRDGMVERARAASAPPAGSGDTETAAGTEAGEEPEVQSGAEAEGGSEAGTEPEPEPGAEPEAGTEAGTEAEAEAETATGAGTADRAEAAASDRAPRPGTVNVLLPPGVGWAQVYHRGRRLPDTAPGLFRLPAGRQVLRVRPMGEEPGKRVVVRVRPGKTSTVRVPR